MSRISAQNCAKTDEYVSLTM